MRMIYVSTGPVAVNFFFSHTFAMDKERTMRAPKMRSYGIQPST